MYETAVREQTTITDTELKKMLHPTEQSRLTLALVGLTPIALLALILMVATAGAVFIGVGFVLATVWVGMRMHEARLRGQAVEVSGENFPELKAVLDNVCRRLGYTKDVSMYLVNAGDVDATLLRLFGKRILWVNAGLVEAMESPDSQAELEFVIGRFVGALKARHLRFGELAAVISGFNNLVGLNLLILPYLRATVLSGDQMGMMISGDAVASVRAMNKMFIGKGLSDRVVATCDDRAGNPPPRQPLPLDLDRLDLPAPRDRPAPQPGRLLAEPSRPVWLVGRVRSRASSPRPSCFRAPARSDNSPAAMRSTAPRGPRRRSPR